jgi:hypothetical protein
MHVILNCLQSAVGCLSFDVDRFSVYAVHVAELKESCSFAGVEYAKLPIFATGVSIKEDTGHFQWFTLLLSSMRTAPCPFQELFEDPCFELCLLFVSDQVYMFQETLHLTDKDDIPGTEVVCCAILTCTADRSCDVINYKCRSIYLYI